MPDENINSYDNLNLDKSNWENVQFGDVAFFKKKNVDRENTTLTKYIKGEHMNSEDLHIRQWGDLKDEYLGPAFHRLFEKGDILYGSRRTYLRKVAIAGFDGITSNTTFVINSNEKKIIPELLPFIMLSEGFAQHSIKNSKGSVNPYVNWKDIASYQFLLPPKDQQAKIAKLLWAMDDVVEKEKEVYTKIESLFLSVSKNVFSESAGEQKLLKEVSEVIMGQSPLGKTYNENGDGFAFLQGNAEFGDRYPKNKKFTTSPKKIAPNNSILISVRAPVGDLNIANQDYCIGRGLAAIVVEDSNFREYIYNFLKYSEYELNKHSSGSTFKAINKDKLSTLKLVVPNNGNVQNSVGLFKRLSETMGKSKNQFNQSKQLQKTLINEIFSV